MDGPNFFRQAPLVRAVFALVAGITFRLNVVVPVLIVLPLLLLSLIAVIGVSGIRNFSVNYKYRWLPGMLLTFSVFCLGVYLTGEKNRIPDCKLKPDSPQELIAIISSPPEERERTVQCFVDVDQVKLKNQFMPDREKLLLYVAKDSAALALKAGDVLLMKISPGLIERTGNPYEFDYRKYLAYQGVQLSAYADGFSWCRIDNGRLPALQMIAFHLRDKLLSAFRRLGIKGQELGVASALTIGATTELDSEVKQAYIASGTMHILAVSGMHVALLYWVLNMILSFLDRNKYTLYLKYLFLILSVWFYALLTGLGTSILRASVMISFLIIGEALNRKSGIFNTLAASAFCLLVWNPFNLVDVGFQLSYLAVIGIVIFHPLIYDWFEFDSWIGDQLWSMIAVTLAAQILTTPISLFYFHQFPNLFLFSNLIMIPLSTLIMYFAMVLIVCSGVDCIAGWLGMAFNALVWSLNKVVFFVESLPFALTKGIYITWTETLLGYFLIVFLTLYLLQKQVKFLNYSLLVLFALLAFGLQHDFEIRNRREMVVYNETNNSVFQFQNGRESVWLVAGLSDRTGKYIERARDAMGSEHNSVVLLDSIIRQSRGKGISFPAGLFIRGNFVQFLSKTFVITDGGEFQDTSAYRIETDYLLLRNTSVFKAKKAMAHYHARHYILDASISRYRAEKLKTELSLPHDLYNVKNSGALIAKW